MFYDYHCTNKQCASHYDIVTIQKSIKDASREENCELCGCELKRTIESYGGTYINSKDFFGKSGQY